MISDGRNTFLMAGLNSDIVECWKRCYEMFREQPRELVSDIYGDVRERCETIYEYMVNNTYYQLDAEGEQLIKSTARLIADGCGDCKSYTMFLACCLHCMGIPCKVRFVNFDGGNQYTHVYAVAVDEQGDEIILDACELNPEGIPYIDFARPYVKKKDLYYV